jgi:hypothetical protein
VQRFATSLPKSEESAHEAVSEPTEAEIGKLLGAIWPRIKRTLTTPGSIYDFIGCVVTRSGVACEYRRDGILVFNPAYTPAQPEVVAPQVIPTTDLTDDDYGDVL